MYLETNFLCRAEHFVKSIQVFFFKINLLKLRISTELSSSKLKILFSKFQHFKSNNSTEFGFQMNEKTVFFLYLLLVSHHLGSPSTFILLPEMRHWLQRNHTNQLFFIYTCKTCRKALQEDRLYWQVHLKRWCTKCRPPLVSWQLFATKFELKTLILPFHVW